MIIFRLDNRGATVRIIAADTSYAYRFGLRLSVRPENAAVCWPRAADQQNGIPYRRAVQTGNMRLRTDGDPGASPVRRVELRSASDQTIRDKQDPVQRILLHFTLCKAA